MIEDIARCATEDAIWLVTDFNIPQSGWPKWRAKAVLRLAYTFFRVTTGIAANAISPPDEFLRDCGFEQKQRTEADAGLIYSAMWQRTKNPNHATHMAARHRDSTDKTCALPTTNAALPA